MQGNATQTVQELEVEARSGNPIESQAAIASLYHKALSANPAEANAAIFALQGVVHNGSAQQAAEAEAALLALVPVLQHRVELGYPNAIDHLGQIALGVDSKGKPTGSAIAANQALGHPPPNETENTVLFNQAMAERLEAVNTLKTRATAGDADALALLQELANPSSGAPIEVVVAAHSAIAVIQATQFHQP